MKYLPVVKDLGWYAEQRLGFSKAQTAALKRAAMKIIAKKKGKTK